MDRPDIAIKPPKYIKVLEYAIYTVLAMTWVLTMINFDKMPDKVPVHFDAAGQADRMGEKTEIFVPLVIMTLISLGLLYIRRFYRHFNYIGPIKPENAARIYSSSYNFMTWLSFMIALLSLIILYTIGGSISLGHSTAYPWLPYFVGALIIFPIIAYLIYHIRLNDWKINE
jgi:uncharacterized membrane protein